MGVTGVDGRQLLARRKAALRSITPEGRVQILRDDYTGQIEQVNSALLLQLLNNGGWWLLCCRLLLCKRQ